MAEIGELNYVAKCRRRFFRMVKDDPTRFIELTLRRINYFWVNFVQYCKIKYSPNPRKEVIILQLYYILSLLSMFFCYYKCLGQKNDVLQHVVVMIPFFYSLPYLITTVAIRYRTPIEPVIMITLGSTITQLKVAFKDSRLPNKAKALVAYMHKGILV